MHGDFSIVLWEKTTKRP